MSHHSGFSLIVLEGAKIKKHFGNDIALKLIGEQPIENSIQIKSKETGGLTRSDWFKWIIGNLIEKTPYQSLAFFSECVCSHLIMRDYEYKILEENYLENLEDGENQEFICALYYTVVSPHNIEKILNDLNGLLDWCENNSSVVGDILEEDENSIKTALESAQVYERLNDCHYGEEGQGADFFFSALKSFQHLLAYAQENALYAIYENENYTSWKWLKEHYPRLISI
jgi:hypothetical protein